MRGNSAILLAVCLCQVMPGRAQISSFVHRSGASLQLDGRPFYFLGTNAYYLLEEQARGDTPLVRSLFATARGLGMNVVRTWAFFDSFDSTNPAVIQFRPGVFNEHALRALDAVLYEAHQDGIRLLLPLVNNWDDYGGMNQYVRWRMLNAPAALPQVIRYSRKEQERVITGTRGQQYRVALNEVLGHDDFYTDSTIRAWYKTYVGAMVNRVNSFSGVSYRDDPTILGWELANEPRSSDRSGRIVSTWVDELGTYLKQIDPHHLVGTGEEGFDNTVTGYSLPAYNNQSWLLDGTHGVAWSMNSVLSCIDFGGVHLYPESWNLPNGAGNTWISDQIRQAARFGKPLVVGEFGVRTEQSSTYDSWLTTVLLENGGGAAVWQLLAGGRNNSDGYGILCPDAGAVCTVLQNQGEQFESKSSGGTPVPPTSFVLWQNYPNPFNGQTTVSYDLPSDSYVTVCLFNSLGETVTTFVDGFQSAGTRKELLEAGGLSSGAYFYRVSIRPVTGAPATAVKKLLIIK